MTLLELAVEGVKQSRYFKQFDFDSSDDMLIVANVIEWCPSLFISDVRECPEDNEQTVASGCLGCWLQEADEDAKFNFYMVDPEWLIQSMKKSFATGRVDLSCKIGLRDSAKGDSQDSVEEQSIEFGVIEGEKPPAETQEKCGEINTKSTEKCEQFDAICKELMSLHAKKSADYGDSFHQTFVEEGWAAPRLRLNDKLNRFKALSRGQEAKVKSESLRDTLIDLAAYAVMSVMEIDNKEGSNE